MKSDTIFLAGTSWLIASFFKEGYGALMMIALGVVYSILSYALDEEVKR